LWQLHTSQEGGPAHNADEKYIANTTGPDVANTISVTAEMNGRFSVTNNRNEVHQDYPAR
jgi:competence protein ComEC